jgi:hypothetical protein
VGGEHVANGKERALMQSSKEFLLCISFAS